MIKKFLGGGALSQALGGGYGVGFMSKVKDRIRAQNQGAQLATPQNAPPEYMAQQYNAPPQYQSFSQLLNQPEFDYSQVGDIYQRGAMPNNLLSRYNSLMGNLQSQQAAMVPRMPMNPQNPNGAPRPHVKMANQGQNPYVNFAQLFGGR